ncbi:MAG: hypothetical protein Q4A74_07400 [Cardiobacteriaceae bacterium]|nr:hypothetical protein [Cardiobacteriaceae bacterium]
MPILHDLSCFSPPEKLRALLEELRAIKDSSPLLEQTILNIEEDLAFAEKLYNGENSTE